MQAKLMRHDEITMRDGLQLGKTYTVRESLPNGFITLDEVQKFTSEHLPYNAANFSIIDGGK